MAELTRFIPESPVLTELDGLLDITKDTKRDFEVLSQNPEFARKAYLLPEYYAWYNNTEYFYKMAHSRTAAGNIILGLAASGGFRNLSDVLKAAAADRTLLYNPRSFWWVHLRLEGEHIFDQFRLAMDFEPFLVPLLINEADLPDSAKAIINYFLRSHATSCVK